FAEPIVEIRRLEREPASRGRLDLTREDQRRVELVVVAEAEIAPAVGARYEPRDGRGPRALTAGDEYRPRERVDPREQPPARPLDDTRELRPRVDSRPAPDDVAVVHHRPPHELLLRTARLAKRGPTSTTPGAGRPRSARCAKARGARARSVHEAERPQELRLAAREERRDQLALLGGQRAETHVRSEERCPDSRADHELGERRGFEKAHERRGADERQPDEQRHAEETGSVFPDGDISHERSEEH